MIETLGITRIILNLRRWIYNVQLYHLSVFPYERSWLVYLVWSPPNCPKDRIHSTPNNENTPTDRTPTVKTACCKDRGRSLTRREMWNKFTWPRPMVVPQSGRKDQGHLPRGETLKAGLLGVYSLGKRGIGRGSHEALMEGASQNS